LVVHFAALKSVSNSVAKPIDYYQNNLQGLLNLLRVMQENNCKKFVFSSSATVYDSSNLTPYGEDMLLGSSNPYGRTKLMSEQILRDIEVSDSQWSIAYLRYFNPVGAHESGFIGEDPLGDPNNLMPCISQVAVGRKNIVSVFGCDWPTPDGSGIRDYVHVVDLAIGHVKAVDYLLRKKKSLTVNLGTGKGSSVFELIKTFEKVSGKKIPYKIVNRRHGDIAVSYADVRLAKKLLNWSAEYDLERMCADSWNWQSKNPLGFGV
jgi:UDP-glucose 4-epimerase